MKRLSLVVFCGVALACTVRCSKSTGTAASTNEFAVAIAAIALTSPTATGSSESASLLFGSKTVTSAALSVPGLAKLLKWLGIGSSRKARATADEPEIKPFAEMVAETAAILEAAPEDAAAELTFTEPSPAKTDCYGPALTFAGDPRPSGDLGIFDEVEPPGTGTEACSAAQLEVLVKEAAFFNDIIKANAVMMSALGASGASLPAAGDPAVDVTADMPDLGVDAVTNATLTRLADDADGNAVYKSEISTATVTITIHHTPTTADNSTYKGLIQVVMPHVETMTLTVRKRGVSMVYSQTATTLSFIAESAANRNTTSDDFFSSTTGRVDFTKAAFGEDGRKILAQFDLTTSAGAMRYAWQAGEGDGAARIFEVQVTHGEDGLKTGYAYFGFGADIDTLDDTSDDWITKFYPNWLNGLDGGPTLTDFQGQSFSQATVDGEFGSDAFHGQFVPTNDGEGTGLITDNLAYDGVTRTVGVGALDFVSSRSLGAIDSITVPSFTLP